MAVVPWGQLSVECPPPFHQLARSARRFMNSSRGALHFRGQNGGLSTLNTQHSTRPPRYRRSHVPFATAPRHGKIFLERNNGGGTRGERNRDRDRRPAARRSYRQGR